ncbi:uncharacterized protein A4U43_C05F22800 [Asparagus officinalis]|uniref:Uncharacterized protein n=1 Tax=Asparagus officinalis TaxID=4686 RepID=A0A5P1EY14_ASPOF|nr:uncharacterized protein LOC109843189 [Asparagus officinalis]ONK69429.1 uncharacterized protein A4U43_C05F22800 [Asparagus officinalis]
MYVTRPLSLYYNSPTAAAEPPPEGPSSGILVVNDEQTTEKRAACCWGLFNTYRLHDLPFPQNKMIEVRYTTRLGLSHQTYSDDVFFVPVIDQPLSSNRYYVIRAHGKGKGKACTCSKQEGATTCCFCTLPHDIEPTTFDHNDIYQQVEIIQTHRKRFYAKSIASDGIPPQFLRTRGWRAYAFEPSNFSLGEAQGLNSILRSQMPDQFSSSTVVGKWYIPSVFVKEGDVLNDKMRKPMFYEMTLEQYWEEIYACENDSHEGNVVEVGVNVIREFALLNGRENVKGDIEMKDGFIYFEPVNSVGNGLGLNLIIWERMRWEEERGGWVSGEKMERVEREEIYEGEREWKKYDCYLLVERFVLKRMNGSVALTCEFKHTNKIRSKWV